MIDWLISIWVRALTVLMHLDPIKGPFVPRNLISTQWSPVPCWSSRWPPDLNFNVLWVQDKSTQISNLFFLPKVPGNEPPPESPTGLLLRELPVCKAFFTSLKFLIKIPQNKKKSLLSRGPRKRASLHVPQKRGPYGNRLPFPEPYLVYMSMYS